MPELSMNYRRIFGVWTKWDIFLFFFLLLLRNTPQFLRKKKHLFLVLVSLRNIFASKWLSLKVVCCQHAFHTGTWKNVQFHWNYISICGIWHTCTWSIHVFMLILFLFSSLRLCDFLISQTVFLLFFLSFNVLHANSCGEIYLIKRKWRDSQSGNKQRKKKIYMYYQ